MGELRARVGTCLLAASLASATTVGMQPAMAQDTRTLHVPSPDWRDQIIYFAMLDRFDDGEPGNNDQGAGEYDPGSNAHFSGGDLKGVERRIGYIKGLGATAIWITPPVANQWWNRATQYGGYHGYWAEDFKRIDAHFGTLRDYQDLSRAIHGAGMYLVQDVVVNHVANYSGYSAAWNAADPAANFLLREDSAGRTAPTQRPFSLNDARDPAQRAAGIYHWTPDIQDFNDRNQELNWQLAGLDDVNTENPVVRDALRDSYGYWIRKVGVDGFRVDTAFHVPADYFDDFLNASDRKHPGIARVAAATGRADFHVFGEGFGIDRAFDDTKARKLDAYMRDASGKALLPGMINFPLYGTLGDVFARGRPTAELAYRIRNMMATHERPQLMPTFVDNHDVDRFLAGGNESGLKQALLAIMTLPGIPTIYYGTEQGFREQRAAMFASGYGSGGRDRFDTDAPLYRYLQRATQLRRENRLFSRGTPTVLADNAATAGAIAWRMQHEGQSALVVMNSSDRSSLLDNLDTGLPPGTVLEPLFAIDGEASRLIADTHGRVNVLLPPRAGYVWKAGAPVAPVASPVSIAWDGTLPAQARSDFELHGIAHGVKRLRIVVDGDLARAASVEVGRDGRWSARVDTADMLDPAVTHGVVAFDEASGTVSPRHAFSVAREWTPMADIADPADDDRGPAGRYGYPTDEGWTAHRQADIRGVRVHASGGALKVELRMREVTRFWNPPNGFDHVAFTVFIQLPDRTDGTTAMPQQNATLPGRMRWHYRLRSHGWSNALFAAQGATATDDGESVAATPTIVSDAQRGTVTFIFPARALGTATTLSGAKVYVSTWDYDGGFRPLTPQAQSNTFGGGDGSRDPLVMDDTAVIVVP